MLLSKLVYFLCCYVFYQVNAKGFRIGRIFSGTKISTGGWKSHSLPSAPVIRHSPVITRTRHPITNGNKNVNAIPQHLRGQYPPPYGGPPPPYPGLGSVKHSPPDLQPPPYSKISGHPTNHGPHHQKNGRYYPVVTHHSDSRGYNKSSNPTNWGRNGNPVYGPFGVGANGGFSPYGTGFGFGKQGFGSASIHLGTFVAGAMLWNLASGAGRNNFHVYHNAQKQVIQNYPNISQNFDNLYQARYEVDYGNMTCLTIYNAKKFSEWANKTIKNIEKQTNQSYPFNLNIQEPSVQFNFTLEPGEIESNETVSITCCGKENSLLKYDDAFKGYDPKTNCVHMFATIPFREIKAIPLNETLNVTQPAIDALLPPDLENAPTTEKITADSKNISAEELVIKDNYKSLINDLIASLNNSENESPSNFTSSFEKFSPPYHSEEIVTKMVENELTNSSENTSTSYPSEDESSEKSPIAISGRLFYPIKLVN